ncbi:chloride channel protein [Segetibacter aerophilus]|uniref:Transporter n=1 Tax=Segetibacter aerophilus TaxID=670293 RepID=A0A512BCQ5_9BACT|nr:chloride channel protein [Segetibacter aerophilus]GEO09749.1 transporter [Segetibacter aerophilus]
MKILRVVYQVLAERIRSRLNKVQFVIYVAILTGLISGLVAVLLKKIVHYLQRWIEQIPAPPTYLIFPAIGLIFTVYLTNRFYHGAFNRGIGMVLRSIAQKSSFIPFSHTYLHVFTSAITVGVGGSVGLESPIVATGSAIGSNVARINVLSYRDRSLMIACGAAAGIAAVFNAPIAGVIFAIEVLMVETGVSYFIPLIISAVIGALCSKIILDESVLFNFVLTQKFNYKFVPFYIILGVLCGMTALYYAKSYKGCEKRIHQWKTNSYVKAATGGLMLLVLCYTLPPLFGEGYESIKQVATGEIAQTTRRSLIFDYAGETWTLLIFAVSVVLLKPVAAAITIGSGGNGGNFAPSLFVGSFLGFSFSRVVNSTKLVQIPEGNFSLAAMAGVLAGVMYCPLTAIFLIAEITNGYELFIPLMIVSSISYTIVKHFEPYSMETKQLALKGEIFTHKKEQNILSTILLEEMIDNTYLNISINLTAGEMIKILNESPKTVFAVHDDDGLFVGILELNDIKKLVLQENIQVDASIASIVKQPPEIIYYKDAMTEVMMKFDNTHNWHLPVLNAENRFMGFISKSKLFDRYRKSLSESSDLYEYT